MTDQDQKKKSDEQYEQGYKDGGSDVSADWLIAWSEYGPDEPLPTFKDAIERLIIAEEDLQTLRALREKEHERHENAIPPEQHARAIGLLMNAYETLRVRDKAIAAVTRICDGAEGNAKYTPTGDLVKVTVPVIEIRQALRIEK